MDGPGRQFLAGAGFAGYEDGRVDLGGHEDGLFHPAHGLAGTDDPVESDLLGLQEGFLAHQSGLHDAVEG